MIWGSQPRPVPPLWGHHVVVLLGAPVASTYLVVLGVAVVVAFSLDIWSRTSVTGQAWLATAEDREAAQARGINVRSVGLAAFVVAAALSGLAGFLAAPITQAVYNAGALLSLQGFVAIAIGGFGSERGALVGGLLLGVAQAEAALVLAPGYENIVALGLLLVILLVKPSGLFGRGMARVV